MCRILVIIAFAFAACRAEQGDAQGSKDNLADQMVDRVLVIDPSCSADLDDSTLAKPGKLNTATLQHRAPIMQPGIASMQSPLSSRSLLQPRNLVAVASSKLRKLPQDYKPHWDAVVEVAGTQLIVEEGCFYNTNRLPVEPGTKIAFNRILATKDGPGQYSIGYPYVEDAKVEAEILENFKGKKVIVYKMKPKKHYRRKNGHRQLLTKWLVTNVIKPGGVRYNPPRYPGDPRGET